MSRYATDKQLTLITTATSPPTIYQLPDHLLLRFLHVFEPFQVARILDLLRRRPGPQERLEHARRMMVLLHVAAVVAERIGDVLGDARVLLRDGLLALLALGRAHLGIVYRVLVLGHCGRCRGVEQVG